MPPVRRAAPPVDPAPMLVATWRTVVDAISAEPDADRREKLTHRLNAQLSGVRRQLAAPASSAAPALHQLLRLPAPHPDPGVPGREALAAAVAAVEGPVPAASADARRVALEDQLLRAVALGRELSDPLVPERPILRLCVRLLARALAERAPGRSVELRVPPHVAVQCVEGPRHTRGTPPNVVEADPLAFLDVAAGHLAWDTAVSSGLIRASGERADLQPWLPLLHGTGG